MAHVKVERVREGLHPSEVVIAVPTSQGGSEKLVVDVASLDNGRLDVGFPLARREDDVLVELPGETFSGLWRVWVPSSSVSKEKAAA